MQTQTLDVESKQKCIILRIREVGEGEGDDHAGLSWRTEKLDRQTGSAAGRWPGRWARRRDGGQVGGW